MQPIFCSWNLLASLLVISLIDTSYNELYLVVVTSCTLEDIPGCILKISFGLYVYFYFPEGANLPIHRLLSFSHSLHFLFCSLQAGCQPAGQVRWWYARWFWRTSRLHISTACRSVLHLKSNCVLCTSESLVINQTLVEHRHDATLMLNDVDDSPCSDVPRNVIIISDDKRGRLQEHELDVIMFLKKNASDAELSQDT